MALIDQAAESTSPAFLARVKMAMIAAAINIQAEAPAVLLSADAAAAATTITPVATTGFATGDLIQIGAGATLETRKITVSGANFTVTALTSAHKAGEVLQKVLWNSVNRRNFAKLVLNAPDNYAGLFAAAIAGNDSTITQQNDATITDATISTDVSAVWNSLAGTV